MSNEMAQRAADALNSKNLTTMSVGFHAFSWTFEGNVRVYTEAQVIEASLAPTPANPHAVVLVSKDRANVSTTSTSTATTADVTWKADSELPLPTRLARRVTMVHQVYPSRVSRLTPRELRELHDDDHNLGYVVSHPLSDLSSPDLVTGDGEPDSGVGEPKTVPPSYVPNRERDPTYWSAIVGALVDEPLPEFGRKVGESVSDEAAEIRPARACTIPRREACAG
jgi:hypothetical protein